MPNFKRIGRGEWKPSVDLTWNDPGVQGVPDQSLPTQTQWDGEGDMAIQPNGINHKAANLAILSYQVDLHTTYSVE